MLSFLLRRALLRPAMLSTAKMSSTRPILSNRFLALSVQRSFATTSITRDAESTPTSEPEPAPKSKPKSTRKKSASSTKASGKGKGKKPAKRGAKKAESKKKSMMRSIPFSSPTRIYCLRPPFTVTIRPQDRPPKAPGTPYVLWFSEWCREQPKIENLEGAQSRVKKAGQTWQTVSDYEKQVCISVHPGVPYSKHHDSDIERNMISCGQSIKGAWTTGASKWTLASC